MLQSAIGASRAIGDQGPSGLHAKCCGDVSTFSAPLPSAVPAERVEGAEEEG